MLYAFIGAEVILKDHHGNTFARGFFNPFSQYRVRILSRSHDQDFSASLEELIFNRISQAVSLRKALNLPNPGDTVYRLVNGEGDRLGGLMIDVLGSTVVIQSSALWVEIHANAILSSLERLFDKANTQFIWRRAESRLKQDGFVSSELKPESTDLENDDEVSARKEGSISIQRSLKDTEKFEIVVENGIKYRLCPENDQKTGFYCDQRDNRKLIAQHANGRTVLDTYCYSGGFSLNAAKAGATKVTAVDSSRRAIETAQINQQLNDIDTIEYIQGDCEEVMQVLKEQQQSYDIVICDPPKLAPTRNALPRAVNKYTKINTLAMQLVSPSGGMLLTCTCSAAMTQSPNEFIKMLSTAAKVAKREVAVLSVSNAAPDHPVLSNYQEGKYLTAVLCYITPK